MPGIVVAIEQFNVSTAHFVSVSLHGVRNIFARIKIDFCFARMPAFFIQNHFAMYWFDGRKELQTTKTKLESPATASMIPCRWLTVELTS